VFWFSWNLLCFGFVETFCVFSVVVTSFGLRQKFSRSLVCFQLTVFFGLFGDGDDSDDNIKVLHILGHVYYILHISLLLTAPCITLLLTPRRESRWPDPGSPFWRMLSRKRNKIGKKLETGIKLARDLRIISGPVPENPGRMFTLACVCVCVCVCVSWNIECYCSWFPLVLQAVAVSNRDRNARYVSVVRSISHCLIATSFAAGGWPGVWPDWHDINVINPLNPELNPICYLLALLGAHHFLHVSRIRVKLLTFRLLMSYIYGAPILDVSRSHTTTQHSR